MSRNLIEYKGEQLSLRAIAQKEGIIVDVLYKYYAKFGEIYKTVDYCKQISRRKRGKIQRIEYNGEMLTITAISKKEKIDFKKLKANYAKTKDIYEAVKLITQSPKVEIEKIEYKGEQLTISAIVKREEIDPNSLRKCYRETGDIYKSVKFCKENKYNKKNSL